MTKVKGCLIESSHGLKMESTERQISGMLTSLLVNWGSREGKKEATTPGTRVSEDQAVAIKALTGMRW